MQREKGEGDHLSTRAYVGLNLGVTLEECLDSVVLHLEGGMKLHPLSAGVVYKNTTTSFEGDVPGGYLLSADEFGWDASLGSTGWLSTKMEWPYGEFQPDVKLDVWKTADQKRYLAFSNVEDLFVEKDQLSALLASNGESPNELSLLKLEQSFPLMRFKALEVDNEKVPANPLIHNDGEIHVWNADEGSAPVMWKADLVCYGASDDERSYCWRMWLGPDSTYDQSLQRVVVQAQDGDHFALSAVEVNDIGQVNGTNVMESPYGGYDLLFDPFTANVGSQVTERSVYLNVEYDKTDMYVDGYVSDSPDTTDLSSDGILGRSVFIAKNAPFFVPEEQEKVSDSLIRRGTWGWLDFGGPKLDSYVPATDSTTSKSLDWTVPQTDNRRPCDPHVMELYGFSTHQAVPYLSTDHVLVRREDTQGNKWLKYVNLDEISGVTIPPDAEVSAVEQSSIQYLSTESGKVVELFNFHETPTETIGVDITSLSGHFPVGETNEWFLVKEDNVLKYKKLDISVDVAGGGGGGGCSCDLCAWYSSGDKLATWTNGTKTVEIFYNSDLSNDVITVYGNQVMTPFWYNPNAHEIQNNFFYDGRVFQRVNNYQVTQQGYYYLKIENNTYPVPNSYTIQRSTVAPDSMQNTDTVTYYALWTINSDLKATFDWRQCFKLPFYSA